MQQVLFVDVRFSHATLFVRGSEGLACSRSRSRMDHFGMQVCFDWVWSAAVVFVQFL